MADNNNIEVGGRLHSIATGNVLTGANEIFDDDKNKKQSEINTETYSLVNEVNAKLDSLSPEQQSALSVASKANKNEANLGYYVCETEGNVAAKVVANATGYILSTGGSIKIKMNNANTADNATLNINSTGANPLYYDGERASTTNTWEAGEIVELYYDGTNFYANNVAGGGKFASGEKVKNVGIDAEPTAGSDNLVKSGGVEKKYNHHDVIISDNLVDDYVLRNGYINSSNVFQISTVGKGILKQVVPGDIVATTGSLIYIAFVKNNIYEDLSVEFSEISGFTTRFSLTPSLNVNARTAPSDAKYLWVLAVDSSGVAQDYSSATINNKLLSESVIKGILNKTSDIDNVPKHESKKLCESGGIFQAISVNKNIVFSASSTNQTLKQVYDVESIDELGMKFTEGTTFLVKMLNINGASSNVTLRIGTDETTNKPLYYRGMPVTNINTWNANEILSIYYDGTNWQSYPYNRGANVGFILPIGNFSLPNYDTATKKLSNLPTTVNVVGNDLARRVTYSGGDITFTNVGGRDQLLVFDRATDTFKSVAGNGRNILSQDYVILGMVDTTTGKHWFTFEVTENNLPVVRNTYDTVPTANSTKLLTSGAVKEAFDNIPTPPTFNSNLLDNLAHAAHFRKLDLNTFIKDYFDGLYNNSEQSAYNAFLAKIQARKTTGVYQIAFITDTHEGGQYAESGLYAFRCIEIFNKLSNYVDICAHGGDISCDYGTSLERYFAYLQEAISMYNIPTNKNFLITKGNHDTKDKEYSEISPLDVDWNSNTTYYVSPSQNVFNAVTKDTYRGGEIYIQKYDFMPDSMFRFIQAKNAPIDAVWGEGAYYYYDIEDYKIRFVVSNSFPYNDEGIKDESSEYKWFLQAALDLSAKETPTDWLVVCIRHTESTSINKFNRIVSAFMSGGNCTEEGITVNYGTLNGGGIKFIHLHGHEHGTAGYSNMAGYLDLGFKNGNVKKTQLGNSSLYPIYVLSIDTVNNKIISDLLDGSVTLKYDYNDNIIELEIGQSALMARSGMSGQSGSDYTWTSSDDNIATVVDGVVSGISVGTVTITGIQLSNQKTVTYSVKVIN